MIRRTRSLRRQRGWSAAEYMAIATVMILAIMAALPQLRGAVDRLLQNSINAIP